MPYKRIKDETNLLAKWKMKADGRHYFHVFLWKTQKSFIANACDVDTTTLGCANLACTMIRVHEDGTEDIVIRPKLGEVHFIKDQWDLEIVAHELCHALIHRIRQIKPSFKNIIDQDGRSEEDICYNFGAWVNEIYNHLWKVNPNKKWKRTKR